MPFSINVGGVWKVPTSIKINVGGVWKEVSQLSCNVAGTWKDMLSAYSASPVGGTISRTRSINTYARVRFGSDGIEYWTPSGGGPGYTLNKGAWMDTGANTNYWVERTINSGTLSTDAGAGRLAMTSNRDFGCIDTTDNGSPVTANVTFDFWDAATGGVKVGSATYTFTADKYVPL